MVYRPNHYRYNLPPSAPGHLIHAGSPVGELARRNSFTGNRMYQAAILSATTRRRHGVIGNA